MSYDHLENINKLTDLYQRKKFSDLVKTSKHILEKDRSSATIWNFLALGYRYTGKVDEAVKVYESLLKANENNFLLNTNAGNLYFSVGRIYDSVNCFKIALSVKPEHVETLYSLGLALNETGNASDAKAIFEKILVFDPNHSAARFRLGRSLQFEKKFDAAAEQFAKTDFALSKTHQLECYYLLGEKRLFIKKYIELMSNNAPNPLISTIGCHASIRFGLDEENSFCTKPMDYIVKSKIGSEEGFDSKLIEDLIEIKNAMDLKNQPLLDNGKQSSGNLFLRPEPQVQRLRQILERKIEEYRRSFSASNQGFLKSWPQTSSLFGWIVSIKSGGTLKPHIHREGWLSGSIYLKMPQKVNNNEGNILFSLRGLDYPDEGKNYPEKEYEIKEGNIVLFPSSLYHQTLPFKSDEERISFAFDVIPT